MASKTYQAKVQCSNCGYHSPFMKMTEIPREIAIKDYPCPKCGVKSLTQYRWMKLA